MASQNFKQAPARRARNSLSRDLILDAAHSLARSGEELSLRGVAATLECSPMALYRHFPDKQNLLLGLLDRVIGSIDLGDDTKAWDERLVGIAKNHLRTLQNNHWAIPLLFQNPDPGPAVRQFGEAMLSAIKQSGASDDEAVEVFSSLLALNYGWAGFTAGKANYDQPELVYDKLRPAPLQASELPVTHQLWAAFEDLGSEMHYKNAIRKLLSNTI